MQFDFYTIEAGQSAAAELREVVQIEAPKESAKATVNRHFRELIASDPQLCCLAVFAPMIGEPPGSIVATEYVDSQVATGRRLAWVVDQSTGLT